MIRFGVVQAVSRQVQVGCFVAACCDDTEVEAAESADPMNWVRAHQKLVLGIAGAVVVLALGAWVVMETGQRRQLRAAEALDQARNIAESGNLPLAASELQKIIETFSGTDAATEAVVTMPAMPSPPSEEAAPEREAAQTL